MLHIVTSENVDRYRTEMGQAFHLRHRVFVEEKGWTDLRREEGQEIGRFDDNHAVHMLFIAEGRLIGYQRMLFRHGHTFFRKCCRISARASGQSAQTFGSGHAIASRRVTASAAGC